MTAGALAQFTKDSEEIGVIMFMDSEEIRVRLTLDFEEVWVTTGYNQESIRL